MLYSNPYTRIKISKNFENMISLAKAFQKAEFHIKVHHGTHDLTIMHEIGAPFVDSVKIELDTEHVGNGSISFNLPMAFFDKMRRMINIANSEYNLFHIEFGYFPDLISDTYDFIITESPSFSMSGNDVSVEYKLAIVMSKNDKEMLRFYDRGTDKVFNATNTLEDMHKEVFKDRFSHDMYGDEMSKKIKDKKPFVDEEYPRMNSTFAWLIDVQRKMNIGMSLMSVNKKLVMYLRDETFINGFVGNNAKMTLCDGRYMPRSLSISDPIVLPILGFSSGSISPLGVVIQRSNPITKSDGSNEDTYPDSSAKDITSEVSNNSNIATAKNFDRFGESASFDTIMYPKVIPFFTALSVKSEMQSLSHSDFLITKVSHNLIGDYSTSIETKIVNSNKLKNSSGI